MNLHEFIREHGHVINPKRLFVPNRNNGQAWARKVIAEIEAVLKTDKPAAAKLKRKAK